jgi:Na+-translocating ferredoxin:NAD+ oxidoreductase RNF subunit RnfB
MFAFPSAEQLRAKSGKTMVGKCGCKGIAIFAEAVAKREQSRAKFCSPGFA